MNKNLKIFAGSASQQLAKDICKQLNINLGDIYLHVFPSGEHYCQYKENIRGCDVFLIQSICNPAHERLVELLVMIDAAKRASADRITVVTPYLGYLRQDRKTKSRTPITARLVADMLIAAGANRLVGMDFHCDQAQGFFNIPVDHLYAAPIFIDYINKIYKKQKPVIVSPDAGGIKRAAAFAEAIETDFAFISKKRINDSDVKCYGIVGNIKDRDVLIIDDMTESCGTIMEAAKVCIENDALIINAAVTHSLLNDKAYERLSTQNIIAELITTDTTNISTNHNLGIQVISVAPLFATAIEHINKNKSITELFKIKGF